MISSLGPLFFLTVLFLVFLPLTRNGFGRQYIWLYLLQSCFVGAVIFWNHAAYRTLSWLGLVWVTSLISLVGGARGLRILQQKWFAIQLLGVLTFLFGLALQPLEDSALLMLIGSFLVIPSVFHLVMFQRFFLSLQRSVFMFGVVVPGWMALIMVQLCEGDIRPYFGEFWSPIWISAGVVSMTGSGVFGYFRDRARPLIHAAMISAMGFGMIVLSVDSPQSRMALISLAVASLIGYFLFLEVRAAQFSAAVWALLGLVVAPVSIGFCALFYALRALDAVLFPVLPFLAASGFLFVAALIQNFRVHAWGEGFGGFRVLSLTAWSIGAAVVVHWIGANK